MKIKPNMFTCPICFNHPNEQSSLPCGHVFCVDCLNYIKSTAAPLTCPMCRSKFEIDQLRQIYGLNGDETAIPEPPTSDIDILESQLQLQKAKVDLNLAEARLKRAEEQRELAEEQRELAEARERDTVRMCDRKEKELRLRQKEKEQIMEMFGNCIKKNDELETQVSECEEILKETLNGKTERTYETLEILKELIKLKRENEELKLRLKDGGACTCGNTTELTDTRLTDPRTGKYYWICRSCKDDHEGGGCLHGGGRGGARGGERGGDRRCSCGNSLKKPWHKECPKCHNSKFL